MIKSKQLIEDMSKYSMMVGSRYKFLEFDHVIGFLDEYIYSITLI
jgi:hypothetical protein